MGESVTERVRERKAVRGRESGQASRLVGSRIRELILSGRLQPGGKLPSERDLAALLGVSRSTVREALRTMESAGIVRVEAGRGAFLVLGEGELASAPLLLTSLESWEGQRRVYEVRQALESRGAAIAAERASAAQIGELERVLAEQESNVRKGLGSLEEDRRFHLGVARATGNDLLVKMVSDLIDLSRELRRSAWLAPEQPMRSVEQQRRVLRALQERDPAGAERWMQEHLRSVEDLLFSAEVWPGRGAEPERGHGRRRRARGGDSPSARPPRPPRS
jgi:GntR family transcriptional repressor for pyruvate dehydrogenase complex